MSSSSRAIVCPSSDHDGARVPVTRHIDVRPTEGMPDTSPTLIEAARCDYCAEGYAAVMIRSGYRVTIWAVPPAFTESAS